CRHLHQRPPRRARRDRQPGRQAGRDADRDLQVRLRVLTALPDRPALVRPVMQALFTRSGAAAAGLVLLLYARTAGAQTLSLDMGDPSLTGRIVQLVLLMTVLSVAPAILLMVTSFTRIVVVLSLLRSALGLQQSPPNAVLIGLSLFLTAYIMAPTFDS